VYFNKNLNQILMKVKCLRKLEQYDIAIDEVSRFLLQESYHSPSHRLDDKPSEDSLS